MFRPLQCTMNLSIVIQICCVDVLESFLNNATFPYRSAYRWWSLALDNILQTTNAQSTWKKYIDPEEKTILKVKGLVERCGVWACLLGGVVCTNIAKFVTFLCIFFNF